MARAATSPELTKFRTEGQFSRLYLGIYNPSSIYTARANQTFSTYDEIAEITYDTGSGTLADVQVGMTLWVGSSAGAYDKGMCRIRKAPTATTFYVGETSEITFADDDYLTVVDDFDLWAKHIVVDDDLNFFMDYDVAYSDQHENFDPVPVMGPGVAVLELTGANVTIQLDATDSWVLGSSVSTYDWDVSGTATIDDDTIFNPTFTFTAAGWYRVDLALTAANGASFTGHRWVYVWDSNNMPNTDFQLESCEGDWEAGGWTFRVTMWDSAGLDTVRDRALVVLFAKDFYGSTDETSIGPVTNFENVIAVGRIDGESIVWDPEAGTVRFTVRGPQFWFEKIAGFPAGVRDSSSTPTKWTEIQSLTVDRGIFHFLHWRTTATAVMDVYTSGDTRQSPACEGPVGSLWQQIGQIANAQILAKPVCDRYGRLFVEIDPQFVPVADRSSIPRVMTITDEDWRERVDVERRAVPEVSMLDLSGVSYDGSEGTPLFSRAPGRVFKHYGRIEARERLLLADQDDANSHAGLLLGWMNNKYPRLGFALSANNRMIDIAPQQYCQVDIASGDTLRSFAETDLDMIPRVVSFSHDPASGALLTDVDFEAETLPENSVTVTRPQTPDINFPPLPPIDIPDWIDIPNDIEDPPVIVPKPPELDETCPTNAPANGPFQAWISGTLRSDNPDPGGRDVVAWIPGAIRSASHDNQTYIVVDGTWEVSDDGGDTWGTWGDNDGWDARAHNYGSGAAVDIGADMSIVTGALSEERGGYFGPGSIQYLYHPGGFEISIDYIAPQDGGPLTATPELASYEDSGMDAVDYSICYFDGNNFVASGTDFWWGNYIWAIELTEDLPLGKLRSTVTWISGQTNAREVAHIDPSDYIPGASPYERSPTLTKPMSGIGISVSQTKEIIGGTSVNPSTGTYYFGLKFRHQRYSGIDTLSLDKLEWVPDAGAESTLWTPGSYYPDIKRITINEVYVYNLCGLP